MKKLILSVIFILIIGSGYWYFKIRPTGATSNYQAVFLSNGQVYFGKLRGLNSRYPVLTDVYYLVVTRPLQQAAGGEASKEGEVVAEGEETPESEKPQYTLIKLGGELHGPQNKMVINRRHILFVEDLKDDSKVVQKIRETKEGK